jgi:hypothetical protein
MCACGKAGRTACVRVIVLLPRNVTAPSSMAITPPYPCTRHWSGAGPPHARSRRGRPARSARASRWCRRSPRRRTRARPWPWQSTRRSPARARMPSARARYLVACTAATRVEEARRTRHARPCAACGCRACKQTRAHAAIVVQLVTSTQELSLGYHGYFTSTTTAYSCSIWLSPTASASASTAS